MKEDHDPLPFNEHSIFYMANVNAKKRLDSYLDYVYRRVCLLMLKCPQELLP